MTFLWGFRGFVYLVFYKHIAPLGLRWFSEMLGFAVALPNLQSVQFSNFPTQGLPHTEYAPSLPRFLAPPPPRLLAPSPPRLLAPPPPRPLTPPPLPSSFSPTQGAGADPALSTVGRGASDKSGTYRCDPK